MTLTFDNFVELMLTQRRKTSYQDEMYAIFRVFDTDNDGLIDARDIRRTMKVGVTS